ELTGIVLTHAHVDHVLGLNQVIRSHDIPVWLNHKDLFLWENVESQATLFGLRVPGFSFTPEPLAEQQGFMAGPFPMDVLYTPGHSPDHVSLYLPGEKAIIAGDVLFRESVGRTDLYKGDSELLSSTIRNKLYTLPAETTIYPGHGPATTIGHEKRHNPFTVAPSA
ncbi:MAG: MBL fold metallo-hydrolase, partial [Balneolaceae bacterium]